MAWLPHMVIIAILIGGACVAVFAGSNEDAVETQPTGLPTQIVAYTPTATATIVPRPTDTPTSLVTATTVVTPIPTTRPTVAPVGARATVTPHPTPDRPTGLGISSTAIVNRFLELGDFDIERDGTVASIYSYDGTFQVGLFGPQNNISEASAIMRVTDDDSTFILNSLLLAALTNTITSWDATDALEWIVDATERVARNPDQAVSKRYGSYLLRLRLAARLGLIELEITR